jgi:hypothetical protein
MLPKVSNEILDYLQTLPKKCHTKDNLIPLGVLFCDTAEDAVKYPILHSVSYYKAIVDETLKVLPQAIHVCYNMVGKDPFILILSPEKEHLNQKCLPTKTSFKWETNQDYVKRIVEWCETNSYNIILETQIHIGKTTIQVF